MAPRIAVLMNLESSRLVDGSRNAAEQVNQKYSMSRKPENQKSK
jgi:hypothetical protein